MNKRLLVIAVAGPLVLNACQRTADDEASRTARPAPTATSADRGTTSTVSGSCVEQYSIDNVKKRDYAFDGIVRDVDKGAEPDLDRVTFDVEEWFKGGSGQTATRQATGFTAITSAGGSPHAVGQRLLVAGDEDFVWECGFTRPYDKAVADQWRDALTR